MNWIAELSTKSEDVDRENNFSGYAETGATIPSKTIKNTFAKLEPVEPHIRPCPLCGGRNFIHGHQGGYFCKICQPGHKGAAIRAGSTEVEPEIVVAGLPCGRCRNTEYNPAHNGYELPDGDLVDGWECLNCGRVFLLCGNKNKDILQ